MKFICLTLLCTITTHFSFAQLSKSQKPFADRSWFSINSGLGIPLGDFADDDGNNNDAGYAKAGFTAKMDLGIKLHRSLGVCVSMLGGANKADEIALEEILPTYYGVSKDVNTTAWKYIGGMGGLYMTTGIGRGALMLKGQVGLASVTSSSIELSLSRGSDYEYYRQSSAKSKAAVIDLGISGVIPISELAFLNLGVDYMSMSPEFKNVSVSRTSSFYAPVYGAFDYKMEMRWIVLNAGIVWQL